MSEIWIRYLPAFIRERIRGQHQLQKIIGNAGWLLADRIFRMGIGLVIGIWVTRYLGPAQYGILSYATSFVSLFSSIALLGLDGIVVRTLVREPSRQDEILGSTFALKLIGGALAFSLTLAAIALFKPADQLTRFLVGITAVGTLFNVFGTCDFWFQSQIQSSFSAYARSAAYVTVCVVKVLLILCHAPLVAFAWAGLADIILSYFGLAIAYRISGHKMIRWRATRAMAFNLLRDSWPILLTEIVLMIYLRGDRIMIGEMAGTKELGIYSVAALLAEAFYFIPLAVSSSVFPSIVNAKEVSEDFFHARLQRYYNLMAFLGYLVALPLTFAAHWLIPFLFGPEYSRAGLMLVGLAWAGVFYNLMAARSYYLMAMNWTRIHFITDFMGCALNVALNFVLIPRLGGMGAVIASIVSYWFVAQGSCFMFKPLFKTGIMLTKAMLSPKIW